MHAPILFLLTLNEARHYAGILSLSWLVDSRHAERSEASPPLRGETLRSRGLDTVFDLLDQRLPQSDMAVARVRRTLLNGMNRLDGNSPIKRILLPVWCDALFGPQKASRFWVSKAL